MPAHRCNGEEPARCRTLFGLLSFDVDVLFVSLSVHSFLNGTCPEAALRKKMGNSASIVVAYEVFWEVALSVQRT